MRLILRATLAADRTANPADGALTSPMPYDVGLNIMFPPQLETHLGLAAAYAVLLFAAALAIAALLIRLPAVARAITTGPERYGALDGFRGVLAIGVFVHHSFAAYGYFTQGRWDWSASPLLNHLGQTTVALFFMITGFLFTLKSAKRGIDWKALYVSRLARLFPIYAVVVLLLFGIVMAVSGGVLREPAWRVATELLQWLAFVCFGNPDINGFPMTWTLIAGVNWSLKCEVLFYVAGIPTLYLMFGWFSPRVMLLLTASLLVALLLLRLALGQTAGTALYVTHFICGIVAACAYQERGLRAGMQSMPFRAVVAAAALMLLSFRHADGAAAVGLTLMLFMAVVGGLSGFGLLRTRAALWLGDISYGIYLIHGMALWIVLSRLQKADLLAGMGLAAYTVLMLGVGTLVVLLASLSYVRLERPAIEAAKRWSRVARPGVEVNPT